MWTSSRFCGWLEGNQREPLILWGPAFSAKKEKNNTTRMYPNRSPTVENPFHLIPHDST